MPRAWSWRRIRDARLRLIEQEMAAEQTGDRERIELARSRLRLHEQLYGTIPNAYLEEVIAPLEAPPPPISGRHVALHGSTAPIGVAAESSLDAARDRFRAMLESWLGPRRPDESDCLRVPKACPERSRREASDCTVEVEDGCAVESDCTV